MAQGGGVLENSATCVRSSPYIQNPFKRLDAKLKATTKNLTRWSGRFIGNNKLQILVLNELILRLDVTMERRALSLSLEEHGLRRLLNRNDVG